LVRADLGESLQELLDVTPDRFFEALVTGISDGLIPAALEDRLRPSDEEPQTLLDDWRIVLARMMTSVESVAWQRRLLELVLGKSFPEPFPLVTGTVALPVSSTATTSHVVGAPGLTEGGLGLILFTNRTDATVTPPSGWTELWSVASGTGGDAVRFGAYARVGPPGGESASNVNFQTSTSQQAAAQVFTI